MESTIGGTRRHLRDAAGELQRRGHEVHVAVSVRRMPEFAEDLEALGRQGVGVHEIPMHREIRPRADWAHAAELTRLMRRLAPDVVHTHSSKAGVLGRAAAVRAGIVARVHTPHTFAFLFDAMFGRAKRTLFRTLETRLARRTARVIAVSESEAETIRASGVVPLERLAVVPNGIDPAPLAAAQPVERGRLGARADELLVCVVGLLNVAKGQDLALHALARLRASGAAPPLRLVLAGHGEEEAALRDLARQLDIVEHVEFLGWWRDVPGLLAACDALLLPSRWEGLPYIVLEALAAGLPVVSTPVDGARELVRDGDTGLLVDEIDADALCAGLQRLVALGPEGRRAMGLRGRALQSECYSLESMTNGLERVYSEVLAELAAGASA